jgi:beta-phosphoglucomutase-like phosphatase (HAD superfamily)
MRLGFAVKVEVKLPDGKKEARSISLNSEKNLFAVVKKLFPDMKFRLDGKYGAEVSEIAGLKKSKKAGLHFTIDGQVPVTMVNGKKLYCSLYHVQANRNMHVEIELVSICVDYPNSIVDPMLDFRARNWSLEPLASLDSPRAYSTYLPLHAKLMQDELLAFYRMQIAFLASKTPSRTITDASFDSTLAKFESRSGLEEGRMAAAPSLHDDFHKWHFPLEERRMAAGQQEQEAVAGRHFFLPGVMADGIMLFASAEEAKKDKAPKHEAEAQKQGRESLLQKRYESFQERQGDAFMPVQFSSLSRFKAAIFDLDGVIVDSEEAHLRSFNELLAPFGIRIGRKMWRENYTGIGSLAILKDVLARHNIQEDIHKLAAKRAEIYHQIVESGSLKEIAGFSKFFHMLEKNGIKAAIASGGHKPHILASMMAIKMPRIEFVGLEDVERSKPAPDLFLLAAQKLGASPSECIVFEDSLGMKAAATAGMPCIALATTLPESQLEGKAALVARDFEDARLHAKIKSLILEKGKRSPNEMKKKSRQGKSLAAGKSKSKQKNQEGKKRSASSRTRRAFP